MVECAMKSSITEMVESSTKSFIMHMVECLMSLILMCCLGPKKWTLGGDIVSMLTHIYPHPEED